MTLLPGQSFFFINPTTDSAKVVFSGLITPGTPTNSIAPRTNYVSSLTPKAGRIKSDLGFSPTNGDIVTVWSNNVPITSTYSGSNVWSSGEPFLGLAQGAMIVTGNANNWVGNSPSACPLIIAVTANPVWTDTGQYVTNGSVVNFPTFGHWNGGGGDLGADGDGGTHDTNGFVTNAAAVSLIASVGPNPYCDSLGTNQWVVGNTYFPLLSEQAGGTNGYWSVGSGGTFTSDRTGKLWFGINDDSNGTLFTNDNSGALFGILQVTPP